jgi:uncharacterized protein (DUF305 family)
MLISFEMPASRSRSAKVAVSALVAFACSGTPRGAARTLPEPTTGANQAAMAKAKADSARYPYTEADVRFMSAMIGHHAQAIVMSGWAPSHEASGPVRRLAERIINAQQDEIATMQRWLRDRGQPVPAARPTGMKMKMDGVEHEMLMPGMLTETQMRQLDQARGPEFDRQFLTLMIQHHRGAVSMVNDLFASKGAGQDQTVFKFATDVSVDQSTEVARMERMLAAFWSEAGPP